MDKIKESSYSDKIYKLLLSYNRNKDVPDMHSFVANIKNGLVFVDCRGFEIYIESRRENKTDKWVGAIIAASKKLEILEIDLKSVED